MSLSLVINATTGPYSIHIHEDYRALPKYLKELGYSKETKMGIITDTNVAQCQLDTFKEALEGHNITVFTIEAGEKNKNLSTITYLYEELVKHQFDRKSCLLALGGGVVGDMTGFVAATYMRGIGYIQVPTTLLSQVDSSVGGKTGFDFMGFKNMVGSFYQPHMVYSNVNALKTLPSREVSAGMGEVIKHGIIADATYLDYIMTHVEGIKSLDSDVLTEIIYGSCKIKANVVSQDEKESGLREILNYGHTLGHAIETYYTFDYLHGECVALGIIGALYMSHLAGLTSKDTLNAIEALFDSLQVPTRVKNIDKEQVYANMFHDKKVDHGRIRFVMNEGIGHVHVTNELDKATVYKALDYLNQA